MKSFIRCFAQGFARLILCALVVVSLATVTAGAQAQSAGRKFLGHEIAPVVGIYLVTKKANVRAAPETAGRRLGSVGAGEKVNVVGKAKGGARWMAVQRDGKDFGFVYAPVLLPLLDGTLAKDVAGRIMMSGRSPCVYTIQFRGRNVLEGGVTSFADYEVEYRCTDGGKTYRFYAPMFITEVPYTLTPDPVYQISIDLLGVDDDPDKIFSMIFLYHRDNNIVTFDSYSKAGKRLKPDVPERAATTVSAALAAAVEMAPTVWTKEVWEKLVKLHKAK